MNTSKHNGDSFLAVAVAAAVAVCVAAAAAPVRNGSYGMLTKQQSLENCCHAFQPDHGGTSQAGEGPSQLQPPLACAAPRPSEPPTSCATPPAVSKNN